ncbi:MAG: glycosyltransferase, partial [Propionibacteriaceae bacterium]
AMSEPTPLRTDRTPCLLFPQLGERGGGLARAVQERASLFARHYERVFIFTTGFSRSSEAVVAELKARGTLHERVEVRNFFAHSRWVRSLGVPAASARTLPGEPAVVSKRQRLPGGPYLRVADRQSAGSPPFRYRYFDAAGDLLLTTMASPGKKQEVEAFRPDGTPVDWGALVAEWVDEELVGLPLPVLFSLQRGLNDPVLLASKRAGRKVASLHNCHYNDPEDPTSGIRPSYRPLLDRPRGVDEMVCLTEQQRRELRHDVPGAVVRAIRYPGRPPRETDVEKDPRLVVLVAQLIERKQVDHAVRAFAAVVPELPSARLEVYGDGPERARLQQLVDDLGLAGSVRLMGYSLEVGRAQARAVCTLMTSEFEGYARVINESLVRGTPVVAYDVRYGPHDLIRHEVDGLLVDVHEPAALAAAIRQLLADPDRAVEMGRRGREILDRLPVADFEQAWLDVLASDRRPPRLTPDALRGAVRTFRLGGGVQRWRERTSPRRVVRRLTGALRRS